MKFEYFIFILEYGIGKFQTGKKAVCLQISSHTLTNINTYIYKYPHIHLQISTHTLINITHTLTNIIIYAYKYQHMHLQISTHTLTNIITKSYLCMNTMCLFTRHNFCESLYFLLKSSMCKGLFSRTKFS